MPFIKLSVLVAFLVPALVAPGSVANQGAAPSTAGGTAAQPDDGLHSSVVGCDGRKVAGPLRPGDCVLVTATGFTAGQRVLARELLQPAWRSTLAADQAGATVLRFLVGTPPGPDHGGPVPDVLTFVGAEPAGAASTGRGNVTVTVPRAAVYRFTVARHG